MPNKKSKYKTLPEVVVKSKSRYKTLPNVITSSKKKSPIKFATESTGIEMYNPDTKRKKSTANPGQTKRQIKQSTTNIKGEPLKESLKDLTSMTQFFPHPLIAIPSVIVNSGIGISDALEAKRRDDRLNENLNQAGTLPWKYMVPGWPGKVLEGVGAASDLTDNFGLEQQKNGGWLDSYQEGGVESTQAGYTDIPFRYNSAWGGQFQNGGMSFLSLPQEDPEMMYTDRFNTPLNKKETEQFNKWVAKESERQGRDIMMDKGAYDVQGFWKSGDYKKMDQDNHGVDTWKKPNHPTFSNQSRYHGIDGFYGGNWTPQSGYQPSKQTADMYGPSYYNWLFGREPERPEHLDASRYMSGANKPSPLYFAMGGSIPGSVGFTYARTNSPAPSNGPYAKKTKASAQDGGYFKNYLNQMDQDYKDWYSVPRGKDDGFDSYYHHLIDQAPMETTTGPAWKVKNTKYPDDKGQYLLGKTLPKDIQSKVDKGRFTAEFIPSYTSTDRDRSMDSYYSDLTKYLMSKNTPTQKNGGMSYYQHGLDWKPKSISRDGSDIPKNQNAKYQVPSFNMPRAASESTATRFFDPVTKRMVSTATTGQKKEDVAASTKDMGKAKKFEKEEEKKRVAERKSAVAAKDKGQAFTLPSGETKKYEDMDAREKMYVSGKALEQRGRIYEDEESFLDEYINPLNVIGSMAGGLGTAPYEAKQFDSNLPYVGAIASPLIAGAFGFDPLGGAMKVPSKVAQSMESGVLSNIHKVNPFAGTFAGESKLPNFLQFNKLDDPNAFWRLTKDPKNFGLAEGAYFNKGVPLTKELAETFPKGSRASTHRYSGPKWNPKTGKMDLYDGSDYLFKVGDEKFMEPHLNFPEPHLKFFRQSGNIPEGQSQMFKKDWLQGWKEVPKPDIPFKSEINWGAWNSEIPSNKALMNEYAAIEKTSKANGSWMKNPDGSPFQGTPEQFVQQNSENFKKAFPQGATTGYRGAHFHVDDFANRQRNDYATFLTDSERNAETYAGSDRSSKTYYHPDINTSGEAVDGMYQLGIPNNFPRVKGSADQRSWRLLNWDDKIGAGVEDNFAEDHNNYLKKIFERGELKDYGIEGYDPSKKYLSTDAYANYVKNANNPEAIAEIKNVKDQMGYATDIPSNTVYAVDANRVPLKSLRYNNGMFDMTNPNIYKALVPAVIGAAALQKQKKGGVIKDDRGQWAHPGEITEIQGNTMATHGYGDLPLYVVPDVGEPRVVEANTGTHTFPGATKFTEFPITQKVNQKENGGWLNQYK